MSLDESGDDNLKRIDRGYPVFVVGGVILDNDHIPTVSEAVSAFKRELFGRDDFVLHTREIKGSQGPFEPLRDETFRQQFNERLIAMLRSLTFSVVACAIRKDRYASILPGAVDHDLYRVALRQLTDQFCSIIGSRDRGGRIRAERRRPDQDLAVLRSWGEIRQSGTSETSAATVRRRIASLSLHSKADRIVGLELADLVVTPIGRHVLGRPDQPDWRIVREKFHGGADSAVTILPEEG